MRGNVFSLASDRFSCHVVQKALDCVNEDLKVLLIGELFRVIPETFTHRFACHVWQRIFELKWVGEPPTIMSYVHAALKGQWHVVANDDNGSLVIQCIFENCSDGEKASVMSEVLVYSLEIAKGMCILQV